MRKAILVGVVAVVGLFVAGPAWADLEEKDVAKAVKAVSENKQYGDWFRDYPGHQVFSFQPTKNVGLIYFIDIRAQLCFSGANPIPCKALKKGYPLIAPLITWDD